MNIVIIKPRDERGPASEAHLSWICFYNGEKTLHETKQDAERYAQTKDKR